MNRRYGNMPPEPRPNGIGASLKYFTIAVALFPSLVWILEDRRIWPWDQAWYGEVSVDLWYWLGHSFRQWSSSMVECLPLKPPGIVWLGQLFVPFSGLFGSTESTLLFSILITQFSLLV